MASTTEGADEPSGNQRGATGEGEASASGSEMTIRPTCSGTGLGTPQ